MPGQANTPMAEEPVILMRGSPPPPLRVPDQPATLMHRKPQPLVTDQHAAPALVSWPSIMRDVSAATLMRGTCSLMMHGQHATLMAGEPNTLMHRELITSMPGQGATSMVGDSTALMPGQLPPLMRRQPAALMPGPPAFMMPGPPACMMLGQSDVSTTGRPTFSTVGRPVMKETKSEFSLEFCEAILTTIGNDSAGPSDAPSPQILAQNPVQQPVFQFDPALFLPVVTNSSAAAPAQPTLDDSSLGFGHAPTLHPQEVQNVYECCAGLIDLLRAIDAHLNEREANITKTLNEMWAQNSDLRKRGLTGGIARKQRLRMAYVPVGNTPEETRCTERKSRGGTRQAAFSSKEPRPCGKLSKRATIPLEDC